MAIKTANVLARVEPDVKEQAEAVLSKLGIPASVAINMLYKQIIITQSLPFELSIQTRPKYREELSEDEFNTLMNIGYQEAQRGKLIPAKEAFAAIKQEL